MAPEGYAGRRHALRARLGEHELDGLIVSHLPNVRYLTGFSGSSGLLLVRHDEAVLLTDSRYRQQAGREVGDTVRVEIVESDPWGRLWDVLNEGSGKSALGFEAHAVTARQAGRFATERLGGLAPTSDLVEGLRVRKERAEIAAIAEAARLACEALEATLGAIAVGRREFEVAAQLERELRIRGSEWHPFPTIVASGPRSALPHARTSGREIEVGDWVLLDFGAQVDGYCADITRTFVVGCRADERQRAVYELVRVAQGRARDALRAGMTGRDGDALARAVIADAGFADAFGHSLGHGLGLEVHEAPRLSKVNESALPERAVVTIEPGVYVAEWGGVRLEDDIVLEADGATLLSDGRTELRELV